MAQANPGVAQPVSAAGWPSLAGQAAQLVPFFLFFFLFCLFLFLFFLVVCLDRLLN
jgi:hypothetical protein